MCGLEEGELVEEVNPDYDPVALFEEPVAAKPVVVDPVTETPVHHHTDACYEEVLVCGLPEHHHTVNCLSDPLDGTQDEDEWLAQTGTTLSGNWADDLLAVAESQLGYEQSERNFQLDDADGETVRHYTRYGNDYGNDYGPWDVMFLSYCLKYADIPQSAIPQVSSVLSLHSQLRSALYNEETGSGYAMDFDGDLQSDAAMPGDIVIYNGTVTKAVAAESQPLQVQDDSADADIALLSMDAAATTDTAPHIEEYTVDASTVGIVSDVDEDFGTLTVISGDVDGKVAEVTLNASQVTTLVSVANAQQADYGVATPDFKVKDDADAITTIKGLDALDYLTALEVQRKNGTEYEDTNVTTISELLHSSLTVTDIPAKEIQDNDYYVHVKLPKSFDVLNDELISGKLEDTGNYDTCGSYRLLKGNDGCWYAVLRYDQDYIQQKEEAAAGADTSDAKVTSNVSFNFQWNQSEVTSSGFNQIEVNKDYALDITINPDETPDEDKKDDKNYDLNQSVKDPRCDGNDAYLDYTVTLVVQNEQAGPLTLADSMTLPTGVTAEYVENSLRLSMENGNTTPGITWENVNSVYLIYSNNPRSSAFFDRTPESAVCVYTYQLNNTKYHDDDTQGNELEGAGFKLYSDADCKNEVELYQDGEFYYPIKNATGKEAVEMKSAANGQFNVKGLDAGTYYLKETTPPKDYNACADKKIVISATHTEYNVILSGESNLNNKIINKKAGGITLPSTGGIGTTIFYVVGGGLMVAAIVLLVTKKRMENK